MKKFALVLVAMSAVIFGTGLVANAYPPVDTPPAVSPSTVAPGGTVTVTGACDPGETVTVVLGTESETGECGTDGTYSIVIKAPSGEGSAVGGVSGTVNEDLGSFTVTVATNGGSTLPSTGSNNTNTGLIIGVGSLLVGLGLFATARTRRNQDVSTGSIG
jgi:LPXTG-motif cell wall-anchored protein